MAHSFSARAFSLCPSPSTLPSLQADAMLHHDPYIFLKSEPLRRYNLLVQSDGLEDNGELCQGGWQAAVGRMQEGRGRPWRQSRRPTMGSNVNCG